MVAGASPSKGDSCYPTRSGYVYELETSALAKGVTNVGWLRPDVRHLHAKIDRLERELAASRTLNREYVRQRDDYAYRYEVLSQGLIARAVGEEEENDAETASD